MRLKPLRDTSVVALILLVAGIGDLQAARLDPAPISDEVVERVLRDLKAGRANTLPDALRRRLDEASELIKQIEQEDQNAEKHTLLAAHIQQLDTLRSAIRAQFSETRATLVLLGLTDKVKTWDDLLRKVEQRFDRITRALVAVARSKNKNERGGALDKAKADLAELHHKVKQREEALPREPIPSFRLPQLPQPHTQPKSPTPPQHHASPRVPDHRLYAALGLGDTMPDAPLPDAPSAPTSPDAPPAPTSPDAPPAPTSPDSAPTEAQTCNYTAADLAENQEIQLTPEIRALAQKLGFSPVKTYQYVLNEIQFEPYYGSLKGAVGTLVAKSGGPTDQASLLIALLRASNIPARYVKGTIEVDDERAQRWVGAKSYYMAAWIFGLGNNPAYYYVTSDGTANGTQLGIQISHVWVEACVPYGNYRGTKVDKTGYRWIPLDPSFKDKSYQAGITTNVNFDYSGYLATRTGTLPHEKYLEQVESYIKTQAPNFANNTLQDVGYIGTQVPRTLDILPASLPYYVNSFDAWGPGLTAETAEVPDTHRYKLSVTVKNGATTMATTTLSYPGLALQRVTLSYKPATSGDQSIWNSWSGDLKNLPAGVVNVVPVIKVDGLDQVVGSTSTTLGQWNTLIMKLTLADTQFAHPWCPGDDGGTDPDIHCVNKIVETNLTAGEYDALGSYAFQASDRLLTERAAKLLHSVRNSPAPTTPLPYANDETTGEFLHLALLKYMRYISDAGERIGEMDGVYARPSNHLGRTLSNMKVQYLFDLPFAVFPRALLIDMAGVLVNSYDLSTGDFIWKTFKLTMYTGSAYEHYIWQENARLEAVSTVRGLQYANETGIPLITLNSMNIASYDTLMDSSMAPYKAQITNYVNDGSVVTVPKRTIKYAVPNQTQQWIGAVYMVENQTKGYMGAFIPGSFGGGMAFLGTIDLSNVIWTVDPGTPTSYIAPDSWTNSTTGADGINPAITTGGDPVNLVTGNMYHTERDLSIKGRGLPIVFERSYNSRKPKDGPLGFGWTHSFNHVLRFNERANGLYKVSWLDGAGGEKFFQVAVSGSTIPPNSTFSNPPGIFVLFKRLADGTYTIREKNGLTYTFESIDGSTVGATAKLLSIKDRNGNTLTMGYTDGLLTSVTDGLGRALTFTYSGTRITEVKDWANRKHQYVYDGNGNLVTYRNPLAVASSSQPPVTYTYYSDPQLNHAMKSYVLPRGNGMTFEYYMNGKVFKHYNTLGETTTFTYNEFRRESVTVNERGFTRRYFFDSNGNPTKILEENGAERVYSYDPANPMNRTSKREPMGYVTQYAYDANGNVTTITNPSGATVQYSFFNAFNQPGKIKDARGNYTLLKYDANGNLLQVLKLKAGLGASLDPATYTPNLVDLVAWMIRIYDGFGNVLTTKQVRDLAMQTGPTLESTYDAQGLNVVTFIRRGDKNGDGIIGASEFDTASLAYDALGRVTTGIRDDWYATQFVYDDVDRVVRGTDATGNLRDYSYDANGNPMGESLTVGNTLLDQRSASYDLSDRKVQGLDAGGFVTAYQYDAAGNVLTITNPDNYSVSFEYDAANRVTKAFDQTGRAVTKTLDLDGKPRTITDPNGNTTMYVYYDSTKDGRLQKKSDPLNRATTLDYDANGNVISVTDNLSGTTTTTYDELNRPVRIVGPSLGGVFPVTCNTYNPLGFLTKVEAGSTTATSGTTCTGDAVTTQMTYAYDDFGRKITQTDALGKSWRFAYDTFGNLVGMTDAMNQTTTFTYGYGHQLLTKLDAGGRYTSYTRNALGQVLVAQAPGVQYSYTYDAAHRLTSVLDSRGDKVLKYRYSPGGLLTSLQDNAGRQTNYLYDPVGRLSGVWAPNGDRVSLIYDAGGRLIQKLFPNGVSTHYSWNADNTLSRVLSAAATGWVSQHDYTYDGVGNRQTHSEWIAWTSATPYQYGYDALNRLVQVNNGSATESYTYDALGNRLTKTDAAGTLAYVYDAANQLKEIHQNTVTGPLLTSLTYDDNGNLITKTDAGGTSLFTYDALNRLVQANKPAQSTETYAYDDQGRRIQKTVGGTVANYLYNGQAIAAQYTSTWNSATALYTHGAGTDTPLIRATATTAQYFHQDGLGSVVGVSNQVPELTGTASYDAWGNTLSGTGGIPQYGYTGREPDETGLIYYRNRYYDPTIGRFIQRDPIGMAGGMNLYAYVNGNPVTFTDPMGTLPRDVSTLNVDTVTTSPYNTTTPGLDSANQSLASMNQTGPVSYDTGVGTGLDPAGLVAGPGAPNAASNPTNPLPLTVQQLAAILYNEVASLQNSEGLLEAETNIAQVVVNRVNAGISIAFPNVAKDFLSSEALADIQGGNRPAQVAYGNATVAASLVLGGYVSDSTNRAVYYNTRTSDSLEPRRDLKTQQFLTPAQPVLLNFGPFYDTQKKINTYINIFGNPSP